MCCIQNSKKLLHNCASFHDRWCILEHLIFHLADCISCMLQIKNQQTIACWSDLAYYLFLCDL